MLNLFLRIFGKKAKASICKANFLPYFAQVSKQSCGFTPAKHKYISLPYIKKNGNTEYDIMLCTTEQNIQPQYFGHITYINYFCLLDI